MPTDQNQKINYFKLLLKIIIMIVQIEILDQEKKVKGFITHIKDGCYNYETIPDKIHYVTIKQTPKGVWVTFRLLCVGEFNVFLSNKNINIIEE